MGFFTVFTEPGSRRSPRLRFLSLAFRVSGVLAGIASASYFLMLRSEAFARFPVEMRNGLLFRAVSTRALTAASLIIIGRALHRRQRSGAYFGAFALIGPQILQMVFTPARFSLDGFVIPFIGVVLIASVWKELDPPAGVELDESDDDDKPLTPRNRGYGEPRSLPPNRAPELPKTPEADKVEVKFGK